MIKYRLICDHDHEFESWFASSSAYDTQAARQLITCPFCHSHQVQKALMAPHVSTSRKKASLIATTDNTATALAAPTAPASTPLLSDKDTQVRALLQELHHTLTKNAEDVGSNFAQEARNMHEGVSEKRPIYGRASMDDVQDLVEEGIPIMPLPDLPHEKN